MTATEGPARGTNKAWLPQRWSELQPLLDALLEANVGQRATLLAQLAGADPSMREPLENLLAECERPVPMLDDTAVERFAEIAGDVDLLSTDQTVGGRYRIERELGRGGMARVYLAEDLKHGRSVAVKVIRPELAASMGRERFLREIGIAARLRHPNIMPLFDSGDADGMLYFVMPYESGPSLRTSLEAGQRLSVDDALGALRDVAKALAYAHAQGVVHRDVKPDNVMLSGGTAVVADFGIAKAVSAARGDANGTALTQGGAGIGTPAYMAPEQAIGDPDIDHRSDIYSFGCLAYELFVGVPPFAGTSSYELISAHMRTRPKRISAARKDVPPALDILVERCLEKNPVDRPKSAQELLAALSSNGLPGRRPRSTRWTKVLAVALITIVGGVVMRHRFAPAGVAKGKAPRTLVVLPMDDRTGDARQKYIATGMADDIARRLDGIGGITVRSGARSEWPTATRRDLELVASKMGSTYLLKTVLELRGDSLDLSAFVVDVASTAEKAIARRRFTTSEIRVVEAEMAARIAKVIFGAPLPADPHPAEKPPEPESYRLTLEGWHAQLALSQLARARDLFQRAVELDPNNARAWSGLASAWSALGTREMGVSRELGYDQAEAAAKHAIELDSAQGSAWADLGFIRAFRDRSLSAGLALVQEAIRRDPGNPEGFLLKAALYRNAWRWDDSRDALRIAEQLDPLSPYYLSVDAVNELCAGRPGTALEVYETLLARQPTDTVAQRGKVRALARLGRFDDAIHAWQDIPDLPRGDPLARMLISARGAEGYWAARHLEGRQRLASLERRARSGRVPPRLLMMARFAAGQLDEGYRELEHIATSDTEDRIYRLPCLQEFDEVRNSPRFIALQRRMGSLPP